MTRNQDKGGAKASARHTRNKWQQLRHLRHHVNDGFWYDDGNVFFSVRPLLFLQMENIGYSVSPVTGFSDHLFTIQKMEQINIKKYGWLSR